MSTIERVHPSEINLVHFDNPKLLVTKPIPTLPKTTKQHRYSVAKNVRSMDCGDYAFEAKHHNCTEVLNSILSPREWEMDGKIFSQKISIQPATKRDVKNLVEKFDTYLKEYNTKEVGLCPIKHEIYSQCFNEVIRQVTLNCAERGYMLIRIRDELQMSINGYKEMYESALAHGIRKSLQRKHAKSDLLKTVEYLRSENKRLEAELMKITLMTEKIDRDAAEERNVIIKRQTEELDGLKRANQLVKVQLESIVASKNL
ncbi:33 kDa inner dynein arm light chain, axonemal-like [Melanaphis sacchari]|uniref:33 kDa inner dynein arm light chain, axonemal-like n=1 Tax=Melanaphis sacchari TaxID=742174 RepID=UPI000DC13E2E|nr:33 kDa inner dynein arm light chain, axonemal-like [Melanaphis sacchari]